MKGVGKYGFRAIPMAVVMGIIFYLSHQPGGTFQLPLLINGLDKVLHACIYAALSVCCCFVFPLRVWLQKPTLVSAGVVLFCLMFGITDEIHQSFIAGRDSSGADVVADLTGAIVAAALYLFGNSVVGKSRCTRVCRSE